MDYASMRPRHKAAEIPRTTGAERYSDSRFNEAAA